MDRTKVVDEIYGGVNLNNFTITDARSCFYLSEDFSAGLIIKFDHQNGEDNA